MAPPNFSPPAACESCPCAYVGSCCQCCAPLEKARKPLFYTLFAIQFLAFVPAAIGLVGTARGRQLTIGAWAVEDVDGKNGNPDAHLFVGLHGMYVRGGPSGREFLTWTEVKETVPSGKRDNINQCKHAAIDEIFTAILGVVTIVPSLTTLFTRAHAEYDTGCNKFIGVLAGIGGGIMSYTSLQTFVSECFRELPTKFVDDNGVTTGSGNKNYGPGFVCECLLVIISVTCGIVHLLMPVAPKSDDKKASLAAEDHL